MYIIFPIIISVLYECSLEFPLQQALLTLFTGFVGVYIAGYILEVSHSWTAVFNQTAVISLVGWAVFIMFGTGKKIV